MRRDRERNEKQGGYLMRILGGHGEQTTQETGRRRRIEWHQYIDEMDKDTNSMNMQI